MKKTKTILAAMAMALAFTSCKGIVSSDLSEGSRSARAAASASSSKRVVGYFCEWGIYGAHDNYYATSIPANKLTHINYAFVGLDPSSQAVQIFDPWATTDIVYPGDKWDTQYKGNLGQLRKLKEEYPHLKVLISVGGWTKSNGFHAAAANATTRARAAENLKNFVVQYGLDGVDIDWEYPGVNRLKDPNDEYDLGAPGGIEDKENYTLFLKAIREALDVQGRADGKKYELTAAIGVGYDKIAVTNPGDYCKYLDALNLMTYDMHGAFESNTGHQAPLYANMNCGIYSDDVREKYNIDWAVKKFISEGVPASKIVVGLPFYSRGWNNVSGGLDFDGDGVGDGMFGTGGSTLSGKWGVGGQSPYFAVKALENTPGWVKYRDEVSKACWLYNRGARELYTYDDQLTIKTKCDYINELGLGGAMYWELDGDDWKNGYDLVNIIHESILNGVDFGTDINPGDNGGNNPGNDNPGTNPGTNPGNDNPGTNPGTNPGNENPGTEIPSSPKATGIPGTPSLEQTSWNGEASFGLRMNMWWGNNGTVAELYENGAKIASVTFEDNSPSAQSYTFNVSGKANGTYAYQVKLTNSFGTSVSGTVNYTVTKGTAAVEPQPQPEPEPHPGDDDQGDQGGNQSGDQPGQNQPPAGDSGNTWAVMGTYTAGQVVSYNGANYTCLVTHVAYSETWNPADTPALWSRI